MFDIVMAYIGFRTSQVCNTLLSTNKLHSTGRPGWDLVKKLETYERQCKCVRGRSLDLRIESYSQLSDI